MSGSWRTSVIFAGVLSLVPFTAVGCGDGFPKLVPVRGKVTLDDQPLAFKTVYFHPEPGTPGTGAAANTKEDGSYTLLAIRSRLYELGAGEVLLAAFAVKIRKDLPRVMADFTGLRVPDRFVFGFGMDVGGRWRNLPSIRALSETAD